MCEIGSGKHTYTLQYIKNTENVCVRETGERQFCMMGAVTCTQIHHHTRRKTSRRRSIQCVSDHIYLVVTTMPGSAVSVASYNMDVDNFPYMDMNDLDQILLKYYAKLLDCASEGEANRCFGTFAIDEEERRRVCTDDSNRWENEARYWVDVGNGDIDPDVSSNSTHEHEHDVL